MSFSFTAYAGGAYPPIPGEGAFRNAILKQVKRGWTGAKQGWRLSLPDDLVFFEITAPPSDDIHPLYRCCHLCAAFHDLDHQAVVCYHLLPQSRNVLTYPSLHAYNNKRSPRSPAWAASKSRPLRVLQR